MVVKARYDAGQQDSKLFPFCVILLIGDRFWLRHGLKPVHCFFQGSIKAFFQFQIKRKFFLIAAIFHLQRFQCRRDYAHILPEQLSYEVFRRRRSRLSNLIIYHFLQQLLSHLSHTVRPKHLAENFHLTLGISSNLFFHLSGRNRWAFFRVRDLNFADDFFAFFKSLFYTVSRLFACLLCPFHNLVYIKQFYCPPYLGRADAMLKVFCGV